MARRWLILLCALVVGWPAIRAQDVAATKTNEQIPELNTNYKANKALRWSILPGCGQIYNGQAWKVPIIYGAFTVMGYFIYDNYTNMKMFKDEYLYRVNHDGTPNLEDYASYDLSNIYNLYNSYNRNFQLMIIITAGIYALNLIDAYVFGHLQDFQIDDNISMNIGPSIMPAAGGLYPTMGLSLRF